MKIVVLFLLLEKKATYNKTFYNVSNKNIRKEVQIKLLISILMLSYF